MSTKAYKLQVQHTTVLLSIRHLLTTVVMNLQRYTCSDKTQVVLQEVKLARILFRNFRSEKGKNIEG
jgi:hypothetical protein